MSANADLITVETYVQQGKTIENQVFHIWAKIKNFKNIFGYLRGPGGGFSNQTGPILLPSYPLTYINLHIKQSHKDFLCYRENEEVSADAAADTT